jgi:hypothetical protein
VAAYAGEEVSPEWIEFAWPRRGVKRFSIRKDARELATFLVARKFVGARIVGVEPDDRRHPVSVHDNGEGVVRIVSGIYAAAQLFRAHQFVGEPVGFEVG